MPVSVGEVVAFGGWAYLESGSSGTAGWFMMALDSSHTPVAYLAASPYSVTSASWTQQVGTYTVPSGVAYVRMYNEIYLATSATVARFDDGFVSAGTQYYHQDHLSNRLITDTTGARIGEQGHYPYGELWYPSSPVTKWFFTGKERDSESNLDYFGARYYSSQYGRFMTPDWSPTPAPVPFADFSNPQTLNLYAYVRNNPVTLVDVDGHYEVCTTTNKTTYTVDPDTGELTPTMTTTMTCTWYPDPDEFIAQTQSVMATNKLNAISQQQQKQTDQSKLQALKVAGMEAAHDLGCVAKTEAGMIPFAGHFMGGRLRHPWAKLTAHWGQLARLE